MILFFNGSERVEPAKGGGRKKWKLSDSIHRLVVGDRLVQV